MSENITVIGAGVIGLSTALLLQKEGYQVAIIARDLPTPFETADNRALINYTSLWAGAHNRWIIPTTPIEEKEHGFAVVTYEHMRRVAEEHADAGITFLKGIEYFEAPPQALLELTEAKAEELGLENFRLLGEGDYPDARVKWGCEYRTWCANPMVYCSFLLRQFVLLGGKLLNRELNSPQEAFLVDALPPASVVVNCSGRGFNDAAVYPTRGQTCLIANPCDATVTRQNADGSWTLCIPRGFHGGTIIGGIREPNRTDPEPSLELRARFLTEIAKTYPPILKEGPLRVLGDVVGLRPTRHGGVRVEREELVGDGPDRKTIVHAYGLGGRGYELSHGVAQEVLSLIKG